MNKLDLDYQNLLKDILENGVKKETRNGGTISVFGRQIRHNMKDGFPLLTTKKMPFKTIVTELIWFLNGDTNIKYLVDNGCNIWNGDAYKNYQKHTLSVCDKKWLKEKDGMNLGTGEFTKVYCQLTPEEFINEIKTDDKFAKLWGELGPIYGAQWRGRLKGYGFNEITGAPLGYGIDPKLDQIANLINDLKTNPDSRRLLVSAWAVHDLPKMVLPPCHYGFQVYTRELSDAEKVKYFFKKFEEEDPLKIINGEVGKYNIPTRAISLMWNQRSVDTFLGLPFNIASYGLLLEIIAKEVNMVPDELIGNLGDVHLYSNHIEQAKEQIGRELTERERLRILLPDVTEQADALMSFGIGKLMNIANQKNIPTRTRKPFPLPTLKFNPCPITGISMEYQSISQFEIQNYQSHPTIKAPLSN